MKLRKAEKCAIVLTLLFVFLAVGFHLGGKSRAPLSVSVEKSVTGLQTAAPSPEAGETPASAAALVNINTAGKEELMTLDGIGEALAQRIIDYREEHGPFAGIGDITNVSGIGAKKYEAIRDRITVSEKEAEG
ncbi:MAG: ComEA family DNA-binding protein [Oscillospiraceae bacterium]